MNVRIQLDLIKIIIFYLQAKNDKIKVVGGKYEIL